MVVKTEAEIRAEYKELHDLLTEEYYNFHNITKEVFDQQNGQIWADMDAALIAAGYKEEPEPPKSTHVAKITAINPAAVTPIATVRTWKGKDYPCDCYVTENIKDQFVQGDIAIGDWVLVLFLSDDSDGIEAQIVTAKIYKTW